MTRKKVVVIGGGTGTYQVLSGLKKYPLDISAVISMADSGGSTGRLRKELGILPPGDVRRAILALSDLPFAEKTLEKMFNFRFDDGKESGLGGHSLGNILLAALTQITGSMDRAINEAARILNASGKIFPVTLDKTNLVAMLPDGKRVFGEAGIDKRTYKLELPIESVYLSPRAKAFGEAVNAIKKADLIVLGPGDLFTSIVPTLLVDGVTDAIKRSKGNLAYVVNLMTKREETSGFKASDFVDKIIEYLGPAEKKLKYVLISKKFNHSKSKFGKWYRKYGSKPVANDIKDGSYKIVEKNFVAKTTLFRHDPEKIAKALVDLL